MKLDAKRIKRLVEDPVENGRRARDRIIDVVAMLEGKAD